VKQPTEPQSESELVDRITRHLSDERLSDDIQARLDNARRLAIARIDTKGLPAPGPWLPLAALTATILVVGIAVSMTEPVVLPALDDELMFAAAQDRELLEDLEFLAWLNEQEIDHAS